MPKKEEQFEREEYVKLLETKFSSAHHGHPKNIALLGAPKTGKTFILKHILKNQKDFEAVYVDIGKIGLSPESFSIEMIGSICFNLIGKNKSDYKKFLDLNFLLTLEKEMSNEAFSIIKSVHNEILRIKPNQKLLVELPFKFLESLAKHKKILIVIDNFENILDLNNFLQIKDVSSAINLKSERVMYVGISSASTEIKKHFKDFEIVEIKNLNLEESASLIKTVSSFDSKNIEKIHNLSGGNPHIILSILKKNEEVKNIEKAFLNELLCKDGKIYNYCNDTLKTFLSRTNGQTLSKIILKVISLEEGLRLSEIAKRIYKSAPVTKSLLERLISADILYKKDGRYYFYDSVLRLWLKFLASNYEFDSEMNDEEFKEVLKLL